MCQIQSITNQVFKNIFPSPRLSSIQILLCEIPRSCLFYLLLHFLIISSRRYNPCYICQYLTPYFPLVLVPYCSCHKLPPALWLKTFYYLYSFGGQKCKMDSMGLKSRCQRGRTVFLLEALGDNLFSALSSFQRPHAFLGL